jgi:hypothetical protein
MGRAVHDVAACDFSFKEDVLAEGQGFSEHSLVTIGLVG